MTGTESIVCVCTESIVKRLSCVLLLLLSSPRCFGMQRFLENIPKWGGNAALSVFFLKLFSSLALNPGRKKSHDERVGLDGMGWDRTGRGLYFSASLR